MLKMRAQAVTSRSIKVRASSFSGRQRYVEAEDHEELQEIHEERLFPFPGQSEILEEDSQCLPARTRSSGSLRIKVAYLEARKRGK